MMRPVDLKTLGHIYQMFSRFVSREKPGVGAADISHTLFSGKPEQEKAAQQIIDLDRAASKTPGIPYDMVALAGFVHEIESLSQKQITEVEENAREQIAGAEAELTRVTTKLKSANKIIDGLNLQLHAVSQRAEKAEKSVQTNANLGKQLEEAQLLLAQANQTIEQQCAVITRLEAFEAGDVDFFPLEQLFAPIGQGLRAIMAEEDADKAGAMLSTLIMNHFIDNPNKPSLNTHLPVHGTKLFNGTLDIVNRAGTTSEKADKILTLFIDTLTANQGNAVIQRAWDIFRARQ